MTMTDAMDIVTEQAEQYYAKFDGPLTLSAAGLAGAMIGVRKRIFQAQMERSAAFQARDDAKAALEYQECIEIDAWLGSIPEADRKARYGSNEAERKRNETIMLGANERIKVMRGALSDAERALAFAVADYEDAMREMGALQSSALAYAGESIAAGAFPVRMIRESF